eukprot:TRINITY_DN4580_c0_g1_i1.p1 TRINITY_DN4580_c0_g1~~TRINITY_DN4580_c0_g1_i1.p1  ORF type:complete len:552 (+),score=74.82 TRINITY_DN4580_c0_g1_i1:60-1715(+)
MRACFAIACLATATAELLGECSNDDVVHFTISLRQGNMEWLAREWSEVVEDVKGPRWRDFQTMAKINEKTGASKPDMSSAKEWARTHGFTIVSSHPDTLNMLGSISNIKTALQPSETFHRYSLPGRRIVPTTIKEPHLKQLPEFITAVHGLFKYPFLTRTRRNKAQAPLKASISPQTIRQQYNITVQNSVMGNISVGQMSFCPVGINDCNQFCKDGNLNCELKASDVKGPSSEVKPCDEADMDVQMSFAAGPGLPVTVDGGFTNLVEWATSWLNDPNAALAESLSYGTPESTKSQTDSLNTVLMKLGVAGKAVFVSSGDAGAAGASGCNGKFNPDWPATSPYVTAVGATQSTPGSASPLKNPSNLCTNEVGPCVGSGVEEAVSTNLSMFTSGGGFSDVYSPPSWQSDVVMGYLSSGVRLPPAGLWNKNGRGYPDIAAFGGQNLVINEKKVGQDGGTSASSPIWVGVWGLLNSAALKKSGKPLGPAAPYLYYMHGKAPHCFNDIVTGDNMCPFEGADCRACNGFVTTKGWDPVTGLGTPNVQCMLSFVESDL